jgi:integrase
VIPLTQEENEIMSDIQYFQSPEYTNKLYSLETMMSFYKGQSGEEYRTEYINLVMKHGGRTPKSWELAQRLAKQNENDILQSVTPHLDNGIPQAQVTDTPCTEGETDMAKRYKFHVELQSGERIWLTGNTISEAFAHGLEKYSVLPPSQKKASVPTVREFVENTYKPTYFNTLKPTTQENYHQFLKLNIYPFLGDMRLDEVNVTTIQNFSNWMSTAAAHGRKKNLNKKSIQRVSGFLSRIFRVAQEMGIIQDNPVKKTLLRNNGEPAGHHKALPDAEIDRIKMAIPQLAVEEERLYMALLAYTGIRLEELLGLMWEDIDLVNRFCTIKRAVTHPKNNHYHIDTPKTENSKRTVPLTLPLVDILQPLAQSSGYILGGEKPWCYSKKTRVFDHAKAHLGLIGYSSADFRTTFGTQVCEDGATSKQCAALMGHSDTRMVERVYARNRHEGTMTQLVTLDQMNSKYNRDN